ncbi:GNAT family N-acetyltransferase [Actinacidiphila sp. DG2A-62]|uniref:GNAT family N-acetyltransferase n=1 Tax=Actinacidiphila sp. DG2A-62 TaxID=3108821 RepID=UPI002DBABB97|nr:GNAT family N-acetyltransferase [Actinacidiphila sp. DG2A-62]MEC3997212.1 GNAT family N-acetyltransferase [Actinacidiphila sp. DG2A-62]
MTSASVLTTTHYGPQHATEIRQQLIDVYAEVYAAEAKTDPFFSVPRFTERLDRHCSNPGWSCVVGEIDGEIVGYAYGRPDSEQEWREMDTVISSDVREYGVGADMFGLCEIMVRTAWRGAGVARAIHNDLMSERPESRASLLVERDHPRVRATYDRWGYRAVATSRPSPDAPWYDAMVLDLRPAAGPDMPADTARTA